MRDAIGSILIIAGMIFILFGVVGIFRFRNFYSRILVASKVDTVGFLTVIAGVFIRQGISYFSFKVLLIGIVMLAINPLTTHLIARSAYYSGYTLKGEIEKQ